MFLLLLRRVHISARTKDYLQGEYELEPGYGEQRDSYLRDHNIETFIILQDKPTKWNPLKVNTMMMMIHTVFSQNILLNILLS